MVATCGRTITPLVAGGAVTSVVDGRTNTPLVVGGAVTDDVDGRAAWTPVVVVTRCSPAGKRSASEVVVEVVVVVARTVVVD